MTSVHESVFQNRDSDLPKLENGRFEDSPPLTDTEGEELESLPSTKSWSMSPSSGTKDRPKTSPEDADSDFGDFEIGQDNENQSAVSEDEFGEFEQNANSSDESPPTAVSELTTIPSQLHGQDYLKAIHNTLDEFSNSIPKRIHTFQNSELEVQDAFKRVHVLDRFGHGLLYKRRVPIGFLRSVDGLPISLTSKTESIQQRFLTRLGLDPLLLISVQEPPLNNESIPESFSEESSKTTESMDLNLSADPSFDLEFLVQCTTRSVSPSVKSVQEVTTRNSLSELFSGIIDETEPSSESSKAEWDEFVEAEEEEVEGGEIFDETWLQQLQSTHEQSPAPQEPTPKEDLDWGGFEQAAPIQSDSTTPVDPFSLLLPLFKKSKEARKEVSVSAEEEDWGLFQS